ncbi:hypothetical protein RB608_18140 [Nocardioides sp. LHD-245]|uniref:hypothetical protein n=1 Tax=Nocardioides sp. LHD-245 TaxID=3051387 RepID=UPI0027E07631|nr:hypothetical protein [Nocardioides sp. LHD-245]
MKDRSTLLARIYRLKLLFIGALLVILGLLTSTLAESLKGLDSPSLVVAVVDGLSSVFLVTGAIGIAVDFFTGRDKEAADTERLRNVLKEASPDIRDAVIAGFAETPDSMRGVATTETLDKLATNALVLRLGDEQFAREIYADVRDQAIRSSERWSDVDIDVRLSALAERSTEGAPRGSVGVPLFEVIVTWDYTLVPSARVQKFACVSNRDEFHDLLDEVPATSTWFLSPKTRLQPTDKAAYELLQFSVDGEPCSIRRSATETRQTYTVDLGEDVVRAGKPVKIRHTLRTVITREGHWLQLAMTQPTKNLRLTLDYTDTNISTLQVTDLVSSAKQPWVSYLPQEQSTKVVSIEVPGWVLPKAAVTFIWTLDGEVAAPAA